MNILSFARLKLNAKFNILLTPSTVWTIWKWSFPQQTSLKHHNLETVTMQHVRVPAAVDHGNTKAKHRKAFQTAHRHFFQILRTSSPFNMCLTLWKHMEHIFCSGLKLSIHTRSVWLTVWNIQCISEWVNHTSLFVICAVKVRLLNVCSRLLIMSSQCVGLWTQ